MEQAKELGIAFRDKPPNFKNDRKQKDEGQSREVIDNSFSSSKNNQKQLRDIINEEDYGLEEQKEKP